MPFLTWLEEGPIGVWVSESLWGYPIVLTGHAVGMAIVIGVVTVVCLRLLGYAREIPLTSMNRLYTVAWGGFILNFVTGCFLFSGDARRFFFQTMFQIKIGLIILGGISLWLLLRDTRTGRETTRTRVIALLTLLFWFGAITAGRLTAYIGV